MNMEKSVCGLSNEFGRVSFSGFTFCASKGVSSYELTVIDNDCGDIIIHQFFESEEKLMLDFCHLLYAWSLGFYTSV